MLKRWAPPQEVSALNCKKFKFNIRKCSAYVVTQAHEHVRKVTRHRMVSGTAQVGHGALLTFLDGEV